VTICLGQSKHELPAHRLILCLKSKYFSTAGKGEWQSQVSKDCGDPVESKANVFHFTDPALSVSALWRAFEFFYTGDYSDIAPDHIQQEEGMPQKTTLSAFAV